MRMRWVSQACSCSLTQTWM